MRAPRVRLSLRLAMLLVLAFACGLGWWAHRARVQHAAVIAIQRAGGGVAYGGELRDDGTYDLTAHP